MQLTRDDLGNFLRVMGDRALAEGRTTMGELLRIMADVADDYSHEAFWIALIEYMSKLTGDDLRVLQPKVTSGSVSIPLSSTAHLYAAQGGRRDLRGWRAELQNVVDAVVQPECNLKNFLWWLAEHPRVTNPALAAHLSAGDGDSPLPYTIVDVIADDDEGYIGDENSGVFVHVGRGPEWALFGPAPSVVVGGHRLKEILPLGIAWFYTSVVDSETGHFVEAFQRDEGPFDSREIALYVGLLDAAQGWCEVNGVEYDEVALDNAHIAAYGVPRQEMNEEQEEGAVAVLRAIRRGGLED